MKVLFAVSNEAVSEAIVKEYQKSFKEIISYKNVYYFNAILKEIQKDKSYDRIVISEDLEPFSNNNYEIIDRFLFEKLDSISDEASNGEGIDIPIILITTDRRSKGEAILVKLFSIGIYNTIIGEDRNIQEVCNLINKPRNKKDAKVYYKIETDDAGYQAENEENVNEMEIQNIVMHYKKLGKNTERYVDSFNNIASQYTDQQLKVIIKFLPLNVKAVLEAESPKYQELMTFNNTKRNRAVSSNPRSAYTPLGEINDYKPFTKQNISKNVKEKSNDKTKKSLFGFIGKTKPKEELLELDMLEKKNVKEENTGNVIVPGSSNNVLENDDEVDNLMFTGSDIEETSETSIFDTNSIQEVQDENSVDDIFKETELNENINNLEQETLEPILEENQKKRRGRPKKILTPEEIEALEMKKANPRKRGRPRKNVESEIVPDINQNAITNSETENNTEENEEIDLFNMSTEAENKVEDSNEDIDLFSIGNEDIEQTSVINELENADSENIIEEDINNVYMEPFESIKSTKSNLVTNSNKIVSFVGTSKNGTSFLVNNLAALLSENGVHTAILDLTKNKNAYYVYTNNEENLRKIASECMNKLAKGITQGISVNKNLDVYTSLPTSMEDYEDYIDEIFNTLSNNYSVVLIDTDFNTSDKCFEKSQEIYLVQSMDVLTIQPLTAFLRDLKSKGILDASKLKVVINKEVGVKELTPKVLIGGISYYNDPAMTFMTEIFDKEKMKYCVIPFDIDVYTQYLEAMVNCTVTVKGYSKTFLSNLKALGNMVYPLISSK